MAVLDMNAIKPSSSLKLENCGEDRNGKIAYCPLW